ncbi:18073_t:CDS:2, partial [Racocetra persica]
LKILIANVKCTLENTIKYKNLSLALESKQYWQPILVDDFCLSMSQAGFIFKVGVYTYHHGNVCNTTHVWRIDEEASEEEIVDQHYKIRTDLKKYLPTYHIR